MHKCICTCNLFVKKTNATIFNISWPCFCFLWVHFISAHNLFLILAANYCVSYVCHNLFNTPHLSMMNIYAISRLLIKISVAMYMHLCNVWLYLWDMFLEVISLILVNTYNFYEYNRSFFPIPLERSLRREKTELDVEGQCDY